jgi:hypothetical protein
VQQDKFDSIWQIKAGFVQQALQDKKKSKSQQEITPPAIPMNKRKCSRHQAVAYSKGAKRLQIKQSQNLGPSHQREELDEDGNAAATIQPPEIININESLEVPKDQRGKSEIDKGKLKPESQNQEIKINWQDASSKQWQQKSQD